MGKSGWNFDKVKRGLESFKDTYIKLEEFALSEAGKYEGRRVALHFYISDVSYSNVISLNLENARGEVVIEGMEIDIPSFQKHTYRYFVLCILDFYLERYISSGHIHEPKDVDYGIWISNSTFEKTFSELQFLNSNLVYEFRRNLMNLVVQRLNNQSNREILNHEKRLAFQEMVPQWRYEESSQDVSNSFWGEKDPARLSKIRKAV